MTKSLHIFARANIVIGLLLMILPIGYLIALNTPEIWYRINPNALEDEVRTLAAQPFESSTANVNLTTKEFTTETQADPSLPQGHYLFISKAGIDTQIFDADNETQGLALGVWHMPGYGTPAQNDKPILLAAHRWGDISLSNAYRSQNLFYNLPRVQAGDMIKITWDQKVYRYQVVSVEQTTYVSHLSDLILITCQFINSPERIIVYAERVE